MNKKLSDATDDEIHAEIERRALRHDFINKQRQITPPAPIAPFVTDPRFVELCKMIVEIVDEACREKIWPKDHKLYIYESAMKAVYGPAFFPWRNSIQWDGE